MGQTNSAAEMLMDDYVDASQARIRERDAVISTQIQRRRLVKKPDRRDQFMSKAHVIDHIQPIRETTKEKPEEEEFEGVLDLQGMLEQKKKREREEIDLRVMELPEIEKEIETTEESSDEERGVYHRDVSLGSEHGQLVVTDPDAHVIRIIARACVYSACVCIGEAIVGNILRFEDCSIYRDQFPVTKIEWYLGLDIGDLDRLEVKPMAIGSPTIPFRVPEEAVGRFVFVKANRVVEDQLGETKFAEVPGGLYDPHVGGVHTLQYKPKQKLVKVVSTGMAGPSLISEECSQSLLKALARGGFSCAIQLYDYFLDDKRVRPIESTAMRTSRARKLPATILVTNRVVEFRYFKPRLVDDGNHSPRVELDDQNGKDMEKIFQPLAPLMFRPGKTKNMLVLALPYTPYGYKPGGKQGFVRFDVDPAVTRDVLLYILIGFQAAHRLGQTNASVWEDVCNQGDLRRVQLMIHGQLVEMVKGAHEATPAYEKMATTPWPIIIDKGYDM